MHVMVFFGARACGSCTCSVINEHSLVDNMVKVPYLGI